MPLRGREICTSLGSIVSAAAGRSGCDPLKRWRMGWDSNPRATLPRPPDFKSGAFNRSATHPAGLATSGTRRHVG